jgi:hypothetical protein
MLPKQQNDDTKSDSFADPKSSRNKNAVIKPGVTKDMKDKFMKSLITNY